MRKQITLTPTNDDVITRMSKHCDVSQSAVVNYAIYLLCCTFNDLPERKFFERINDFYWNYYVKQLPRGVKANDCKSITRKI